MSGDIILSGVSAGRAQSLLRSAQHNIETAQEQLDTLKELLKPSPPPPPPSANVFPAEHAQTMPNNIYAFMQAQMAKKDAPPPKQPHHPLHAILVKQSRCGEYLSTGVPCAACAPAYNAMIENYEKATPEMQKVLLSLTEQYVQSFPKA